MLLYNGPRVVAFESVDEIFPPLFVLEEDYGLCEETVAGGQTEWNLLEIYKRLGSLQVVVRIFDDRETRSPSEH